MKHYVQRPKSDLHDKSIEGPVKPFMRDVGQHSTAFLREKGRWNYEALLKE